jgi:hypothetical protein
MRALPELNDGRLYDLLEAAGEQALASIRLLARFIEEGGKNPAALAEPVQASAKASDELRAHLVHAIVASLPKAEVEVLCSAIAAIPTAAERFAARFGLAADSLGGVDFGPPLSWMEELIEIVCDTVRQLRGFESLDRIKDLCPRLQTAADHAEALIQEIVNRAYQSPTNPLDVMKVKDLGDQMIEIIDRCREAGEVMSKISFQFL